MQKIAFIGHYKTFRYQDIGGTNSIVRRISNSMSANREIFHLSYGIESKRFNASINGIKQHHFVNFRSMLHFAYENDILDLIIVYLKPVDYLKLLTFRIFHETMTFHTLITGMSSTFLKRTIYKLTTRRVANGKIFCVSKRLASVFKKCEERVIYILPPVDDSFFSDMSFRDKKIPKKIRIAFMGRIDHGKGADIAINFFENCTLPPERFEFYLYGYPLESDARSLAMHNKLMDKNCTINYVQTLLWNGYSPKVDEFLSSIIDEVDLFYLPYRTINSTIDTPLVPLEILSRGGIFLTTDFQQLRDITYDKQFIQPFSETSKISVIEDRILRLLNEHDPQSQSRFLEELDFKTSSVASLLDRSICE